MTTSPRLPRGEPALPRRADPARPQQPLMPDGRPLREIVSYSRRGSRFTPRQKSAWDAHSQRWLINEPAAGDLINWDQEFGRSAPVIVEIGSGIGESTAQVALDRPEANVVSVEVWRPGVAEGMGKAAALAVTNVRFSMLDAQWLMAEQFADESLSEVHTFFPDPWHKKRHHKRRLVDGSFATLVASRLLVGGVWRLATDWAPYAEVMREVLNAEPLLVGGPADRWEGRPVTKFERKGLAEGRSIADFCYRRIEADV